MLRQSLLLLLLLVLLLLMLMVLLLLFGLRGRGRGHGEEVRGRDPGVAPPAVQAVLDHGRRQQPR